MKIAVWILSDYKQQMGGGFALYDKFVQLIDAYTFSPELDVCFIGYNPESNYTFKKRYTQLNFFRTIQSTKKSAGRKMNPVSLFIHHKLSRISHRIGILSRRERAILSANDIDLVFYPVQGFRKIPNFPFVVSNWDIGHKASYAFPELGMNYSFDYRNKWYTKGIFKALSVYAESNAGKEELMYYTHLNPQRIQIVPLFPGGVVDIKVDDGIQLAKLSALQLAPQKYFFYPAQFWAHKNHYNLLLAFKILATEYPEIKLVLTGSDKGNKTYINETVEKLGLTSRIVFPGFIDNETMVAVYSHAAAMVMPSFFGPTNMPLLEARALGCPVLCSDLPGHKEMMASSALYFDPAKSNQIYEAMKKILDPVQREQILSDAGLSLAVTPFTSDNALTQLNKNFLQLIPIRKAWGKSDKIF